LISSTVQAATLIAAGHAAAAVVSRPVAALTEGVLKAMFLTKVKTASAVVLMLGLLGAGLSTVFSQAPPAPAVQPQPPAAEPPAAAAPVNLPVGPAPVQVLASVTDDHKLVVKTAVVSARMAGAAGPGAAPLPPVPGPGTGAGAPMRVEMVTTLRTQTYELKDVQAFDAQGRKLDAQRVAKLLKAETVAMALWGQALDPLHLRVLKEGTLTFVLPAPPAPGPGLVPPGAPGGVAPPGQAVPPPLPGGTDPVAPGPGGAVQPGVAPVPPANGGPAGPAIAPPPGGSDVPPAKSGPQPVGGGTVP
jgi:hypothetical protein